MLESEGERLYTEQVVQSMRINNLHHPQYIRVRLLIKKEIYKDIKFFILKPVTKF